MNNTPTPRTDDGGRYCSHQRRERWIKQPTNTMNNTTNAAKRPSGLRACADGLDANPDKEFAQKCMRHAADQMEELESSLAAVTEQRDRMADLVKQFIYILDITEESDGGRLFHPTNITSCRAGDLQKAGQLVEALRRAVKGGSDES